MRDKSILCLFYKNNVDAYIAVDVILSKVHYLLPINTKRNLTKGHMLHTSALSFLFSQAV